MLSDRKKQYGIILDKDVKKEIDNEAKKIDRSASWLINEVLKEHIDKKSPRRGYS